MAALFFLSKLRNGVRILSEMRIDKVFCVAAMLLAGCAWHHRKKVESAPQPRLVGSIAFVNEQLGFVLVDVGSLYTPAAGSALKSFADGQETAVLAVSPERKRPFITADIVKGAPHRGDLVYE